MPKIVRSLPPLALAAALLVGAVGCREASESLTGPSAPAAPALATTASPALSFSQISASSTHTCGVTVGHRAYCWGSNSGGQLGDGTTTSRLTPVAVAGGLLFSRVSAGPSSYTCGITTTNRAYCWGANQDGQLGDGTTTARATPTAVAGGHSFRQVSAGLLHACAVTLTDLAFCWGNNELGRLGTTGFIHLTPARVVGGLRFLQVIAGTYHTCGVTTVNVGYCWGANGNGQLGNVTFKASSRPVAVAGGLRFRTVIAGGGIVLIPSEEQEDGYSCGLTTEDLAYCWGDHSRIDGFGSSTPAPVPGGRRFRGLNLSFDHACAVTFADVAFCWGENGLGQLGDGTTTTRRAPVRVAGGWQFLAVTTNPYASHTCGFSTERGAFCWGLNSVGELGDGTTVNRLLPVPVAGPM